jgi:hypothetical protein
MSGIIDPGPVNPTRPSAPVEGPGSPLAKEPEGGKEFHGPEAGKTVPQGQSTEKPSLMDLAGQMGHGKEQVTQESLSQKLGNLQDKFGDIKTRFQNQRPDLRVDQERAFDKLVDKLNGDMRQITKQSGAGEFSPKKRGVGEKMVDFLTGWLDGSQKTLSKALTSVSGLKDPNPADLMNLQYSVQRATQRSELFSTIIGSSVSGIKTIMSTQLG